MATTIINVVIVILVIFVTITVVVTTAIITAKRGKRVPTPPAKDKADPQKGKNEGDNKGFWVYLKGHPKQWSVLVSWFVLNLVAASLVGDIYWALFDPFWFWFGIQLAVVAYAVNWFPIGSDGKEGRQWVHRLITTCIVIGTIFWAFGLEVETQDEGPAKFTLNNAWAGWQDKEVEPSKLVDEAERWLLERSQAKATAETKAVKEKTENWKERRVIVASKSEVLEELIEIELPQHFSSWQVVGLDPNPDGLWEMWYVDFSGELKSYVGGGPKDYDLPTLPANAKLRFRSLEKEPLNILVQWR